MSEKKTVIICPTYNPGVLWKHWINVLKEQKRINFDVIILDSSSSDGTRVESEKAEFTTIQIPKADFNHAGTRNKAAQYAKEKFKPDILVFLTQDALLDSELSVENIIKPFTDPDVAAVCGRQLPHDWADPIAKHSRLFNYKENPFQNSSEDIPKKGLKTAYMSNSLAAYRMSVYEELGGFPEGLIFGEDMFLSANMILAGYKTYYAADATVRHSHNYTLKEEFKRYFDIGVFHSSQPFLLQNFGNVSGEGARFAISELKYCINHGSIFWGLNSIIRTGLKFVGYKLGLIHVKLPTWLNKKLSMDSNYWK